ncbi:pentatricopeptide repeat-containing protein At2g19280-like [Rosa chinensis]|uniref:pentatricopeptide repeat-containing protein At2g19280-like n=1 Tax=Rosa chinensis TaxID=74649 RepID=UPI001AD8BD8A|nr:pentatricopeptide repeat-containing protein At2g19280-like [Rosa chinensis]
MDGFGRKGRHLQKVFGVLDMMNSSNVSPDVVTYNTLIHSLATRGFANEAKQIMFELIKRGFSLDVAAFTNVIDGFSKKGNFEEVFFVWFCMSEHEVKPDVVTCSALLNGYCKKRQMEQANVLFRKMLDIGLHPDLIVYNTLIRGFCSVGSIDDACNLICMMVENDMNKSCGAGTVLGCEQKRNYQHGPGMLSHVLNTLRALDDGTGLDWIKKHLHSPDARL